MVLLITVYPPFTNEISGGRWTASGLEVRDGLAACAPGIPFGTTYVLPEYIEGDAIADYRLRRVVRCYDRGPSVQGRHIDLCLMDGNAQDRLRLAYDFGHRYAEVLVYPTYGAYLMDTLPERKGITGE